uniref:CARD domain-containing protein n=1 Tax=Cyprinodon variegatus TaxID=28743 RepID=A0A3Q2DV04_CYPVA
MSQILKVFTIWKQKKQIQIQKWEQDLKIKDQYDQTKMDKARVLVDTVKKKGNDASSAMISFLCELDPFFSQHLGLI